MTTTALHSTNPEQQTATIDPAPPDQGRRTIDVRRWAVLLAKVLLPGGLFALCLLGALPNPAQGRTIDPNAFPATRLSADPVAASNAPTPPNVGWVKQVNASRMNGARPAAG